jgi:cyanophycin synthetase
VKRGTWMGHVIEHIALEIQTLAGMDTGFGRTRSTRDNGIYNVVFSYIEEPVGMYAAKAAVRIAEALISGRSTTWRTTSRRCASCAKSRGSGPARGASCMKR